MEVLDTVGDLRPLLEGRPGAEFWKRWFDGRGAEIPAGAFPAGWVPGSV
jgi:hypothetical protein